MTVTELAALDVNVRKAKDAGFPEDVRRRYVIVVSTPNAEVTKNTMMTFRLADKHSENRFAKEARSHWLEMGLVSFTISVHIAGDGRFALQT